MSSDTEQRTLKLEQGKADIKESDVFKRERDQLEVLYEAVYVDQHKVLLRSNQERNRKNKPEYRMIDKQQFEQQVEYGMFEPTDESFEAPSSTAENWTDVGGVGEQTNENLHESGYKTKIDVRQADVDDLLEVGGIGKKTAKNLKTEAR